MITGSEEFRLCVECCRWAFAGGDAQGIRKLSGQVDWARFTRVARYHRIQGLVWNALWSVNAAVPAEFAESISSDARAIAAANLRIAAEARALGIGFDRARVDHLFVKGLTIGALAYPKPLLKMGWDIDVLIEPAQLAQAVSLLRQRGYRQVTPSPPADLRSWHRRSKESVWSRDPQLHVELHTRLADNRAFIPTLGVRAPRQLVEVVDDVRLPTLQDDELFAYLCVHGASSAWFRLKWITDLAALIHRQGLDVERVYRRSVELGAGRAPAQALLLAHALYGSLAAAPKLREELERTVANRLLFRAALRQLAGRRNPVEPTEWPLGTLTIHWTQLLLRPGARFKLAEVARQARAALG